MDDQAGYSLSGGQRPAVAVARATAWGQGVIIMDEPTAALGVKQAGEALELVRRIRAHGLAVVVISHDMPQVFAIADRIHVIRVGRRAATFQHAGHDHGGRGRDHDRRACGTQEAAPADRAEPGVLTS
jgi:fructose transport system ATP-binding protein